MPGDRICSPTLRWIEASNSIGTISSALSYSTAPCRTQPNLIILSNLRVICCERTEMLLTIHRSVRPRYPKNIHIVISALKFNKQEKGE